MTVHRGLLWLGLLGLVVADVYMHNPRGSNDRNCEKNVNRNNGNRLFDSQNNAKGGYACGRSRTQGPDSPTKTIKYHAGSKVAVEWTNQHGCGTNAKTSCEIVLQYACEDTLDPTKKFRSADKKWIGAPRDGTPKTADDDAATDRIPDTYAAAQATTVDTRRFGMHESFDFYEKCRQRKRNRGLYTADQDMNRRSAIATRQNPNGNRRGLECPEERDYYPYWAPNPWRDIAVITSNPERCDYYKEASVETRGECVSAKDFYGPANNKNYYSPKCPGFVGYDTRTPARLREDGEWPNNKVDCELASKKWQPARYSLDHPDSVAMKSAQKAAGLNGNGFRYETFEVPRSAACGDTVLVPVKSTVSIATEAWASKPGQTPDTTFAAGKASIPGVRQNLRYIATKQAFTRPVKAKFTVQAPDGETRIILGMLSEVDSRGDVQSHVGYAAVLGYGKSIAVSRPGSGVNTWNPAIVAPGVDFTTAPVVVEIEALQTGWVHVYVGGKEVDKFFDPSSDAGVMYVSNYGGYPGGMKAVLSGLEVTENYGTAAEKTKCASELTELLLGEAKIRLPNIFSSVGTDSVSSCASDLIPMGVTYDTVTSPQYTKVSGYFKPTKAGTFKFGLNRVAGAHLFLKTGADATRIVAATPAGARGTLVYTDTVDTLAGWSSQVSTPLPDGEIMHGPYGGKVALNKPWEILSIKKDLTGLATHTHIKIKARVWAMGTWDREFLTVKLDGADVWSRMMSIDYERDQRKYVHGCATNKYMSEPWASYGKVVPGGVSQSYQPQWNCYYDIDVVVPHTGATANLEFGSTINEDKGNEAWAVSEIKVYIGASAAALAPGSTWQASRSVTLAAGKAYHFAAIVPAGTSTKPLKVGVASGNTAMTAMATSSPDYKVCASSTCSDELNQCQPKAAVNCECEDWSTARPDLEMAPGSSCCANPSEAKRSGPWCYCKAASMTKKATFTTADTDDFTGWNNDIVTRTAKDAMHGPYDTANPILSKSWAGLNTHRAVRINFKFFAIDQINNEYFTVMVDGREAGKFRTRNDWDGGECQTEEGFKKYADAAKIAVTKDPNARWEHVVCFKDMEFTIDHASSAMTLEIVSMVRSEKTSRSWAVGAVSVSITSEPEVKLLTDTSLEKEKVYGICSTGLAKNKGMIALEEPTQVTDETSWSEAVDVQALASEELEAPRQQVECLDGTSSTSRENQLGNARGTANADPKIPHGINANRYIWTVPETLNQNCVLRLRYNISTSDYWAWDNAGTPKTDSSVSNPGRRRRDNKNDGNRSPVMQDPYIGIGDTPEATFLSLAINTNQYGRTFQDRSHVFEIASRPAGIAKDAEIINVNVRGKRGNIVQTYPAVEYDFIPNDLCLNKGDYVHFQWTGSDFNPQRNPNDAEGSGDVGPGTVDQASRADRSNFVELDLTPRGANAAPTDPSKGYPRSKFQNGAGQHNAEVGLGMNYPAGFLSDFKNLDSAYTGMFWKSGKPDKATIMKLAFVNQVETLKGKNQQCKKLPELLAIHDRNKRERDPRNCAKLNAADTPYFDAGLVKMEKAGAFPFFSSRNNNFSNRNQAGAFCVAEGNTGKCPAGKGCAEVMEGLLRSKQRQEKEFVQVVLDQSEL